MASKWDTGDASDMVSIGTHKLFLSASGPDREPGQPIVLLMQGMGSVIDEWVVVKRLVTPFARWVEYDRSGLGRSESAPGPPGAVSAASVAVDLDRLLKNAGIDPPYLIVCHSWGGITSREFLHLRPNDIVGMVFVDANAEDTPHGTTWPHASQSAVEKGLNWVDVTGLAKDQKLSSEEWSTLRAAQDDPRNHLTEAAESRGYNNGDPAVLATKKQFEKQPLGNHAISVIEAEGTRDFQRMYDAGVAAGNGTEEERKKYREHIKNWEEKSTVWQKGFLQLSNVGRHRKATCGHNVQMMEPELVAEEIRWVWDNIPR